MYRLLLSVFHLFFNDTLPDFTLESNSTSAIQSTTSNSLNSKLSMTNLSINIIGDYIPNLNNVKVNKSGSISVLKIDSKEKKSDNNNTQSQITGTKYNKMIYDNSTISIKYAPLNRPSPKLQSSDFLVLAAGDICGETRIAGCKETGNIIKTELKIESKNSPLVLALGDLAYKSGTISQFKNNYHPNWGMFKKHTYPTVGNHEQQDKYKGYYKYWGNKGNRTHPPGFKNEGFYSFDLGKYWHLIALNTYEWTKTQKQWLIDDLSSIPRKKCILVFGHKPRYSPGKYGPIGEKGVPPDIKPIFDILVKYNVDLYLAGHDHLYARYRKQNGNGKKYKKGTAHFLVGSGGVNMQPIFDYNMANLEAAFTAANGKKATNKGPYGVLRLVLKKGRYDFDYLVTDGDFRDSGSTRCNG